MTPNILEFVRICSEVHSLSPVVEYGARYVEGHDQIRPLFPDAEFIGCDIQSGEGVDKIDDLSQSTLPSFSAGTLVVCSTLEHVFSVEKAFFEMARIVKQDGLIIIAVPFAFPFHHLPDYWRFTPQLLSMLLTKCVGPHKVYFQGKYHMPHTVFGVAGYDDKVLSRVNRHLESNLQNLPGMKTGERVYRWDGPRIYLSNWSAQVAGDEDPYWR